MSQVRGIFSVFFTVDVNVPNATETVIATLGGIDTPAPDSIIKLKGWANVTPTATHTSITLTIRRTNLAGAIVGEAVVVSFVAAAGQQFSIPIMVQDQPGDVASQVYVLTCNDAGGAAAVNATQGYLEAIV